MRIRRIAFSLVMIMLLNLMLPILTYASITTMDYRKLVSRYIEKYGIFETPISNFEVYVNGEYNKKKIKIKGGATLGLWQRNRKNILYSLIRYI